RGLQQDVLDAFDVHVGIPPVDSVWKLSSSPPSQSMGEINQKQQHPQNHDKGVMIEITALHATHLAGEPADGAGGAVDRQAVDHAAVARAPQQLAGGAGAAGEYDFVEA